jgi:hypothetical protein
MLAAMDHLRTVAVVAASVVIGAIPGPERPPARAGWRSYDAAESGFSASFPGKPLRQDVPAGPQRLHVYALSHGTAEFLVNVMIPPAGTPVADILEDTVRMFTAQKGIEVLRNERVTGKGLAAREFHVKSIGGAVAFLWIAGDDRLYQAAVRVVGTAPLPEADVRTFFDSFRLTPVVAVPKPPPVPLSQWKEYEPRRGRFAVRLPFAPSEQESSQDGVVTRMWSTDADQVAYSVLMLRITGKRELPPAFLEEMLDNVARKSNASASVTKGPPFTVSGFPAREVTVDDVGGHSVFRFVLAKDRLYQLSVIAVGARWPPPGETPFLTSFRVSR